MFIKPKMGTTSDLIKDAKGNLVKIKKDTSHGKNKPDIGNSLIDFEIIKNLGKGQFGIVDLVKSKKNEKCYAMKKLELKKIKEAYLIKEIKLLEQLNHPHVINYFTSFKENGFYYIVVEYIDGQNLKDVILEYINKNKYMEEKIIWELLIQCLSGLLYLHNKKKIIHRDVKPDNLLLDKNFNLKISDFGVSAIDDITADEIVKFHNTQIGPVSFFSPEVVEKKNYDFKSDNYMLGLTFFLLASKKSYINQKRDGLKIITKQTNEKIPNVYSDDLKQFILNLLKNQEERPNSEQAFLDALYIYTFKYLKVTSIMSLFFCFNSISSVLDYFKDNELSDKIIKDVTNNYIFTKSSIEVLNFCNPYYFSFEQMKQSCLLLRYLCDKEKKDINKSPEISLYNFILFILSKLNKELHEENENDNMNQQLNGAIIDETNEDLVIETTLNKWKKSVSIISDEFFFLKETIIECLDCQKTIKLKSDYNCLLELNPDNTSRYLKKNDININDLLEHYRKKRKYGNSNIFCKNCNKYKVNVYETKIIYTSSPNLILQLNYQTNNFNLIIEEKIDIKNYVRRNDVCKTKYQLTGVIFYEYNSNEEKVYSSISKNENNQWLYFNGKTLQLTNLNEIYNHKNLEFLLYSILEENEK